jgi:hypothetical protein
MSIHDCDGETFTVSDGLIGPIVETNRYGRRTGARYYKCSDCEREVLVVDRDHFSHHPECSQT